MVSAADFKSVHGETHAGSIPASWRHLFCSFFVELFFVFFLNGTRLLWALCDVIKRDFIQKFHVTGSIFHSEYVKASFMFR